MKKAGPVKWLVGAMLAAMAGSALAQAAGTGAGTPAAGGSGSAASAAGSTAAQAGPLAAADRNFLVRAAGSGLAEVEAARLAADKAQDAGVKRYAAMLVEQHSAANQELMGLAQSKGLSLPTSAPAGKRRELNRLNREKGEDFDALFVQNGVREHKQDVRLFREASRNAKDPEVKAWAAKMLPTLEQHLREAQALPAAKRPINRSSSVDTGA